MNRENEGVKISLPIGIRFGSFKIFKLKSVYAYM